MCELSESSPKDVRSAPTIAIEREGERLTFPDRIVFRSITVMVFREKITQINERFWERSQ